jgi:hypothetical protein
MVSTPQMLTVLEAKGSCISATNGSASDSMSATGTAICELWCGLCRTILCQTRISKEQDSSEMLCRHFYLPTVKAIHLELVSNLTSDAFIAALRKFLHDGGNV